MKYKNLTFTKTTLSSLFNAGVNENPVIFSAETRIYYLRHFLIDIRNQFHACSISFCLVLTLTYNTLGNKFPVEVFLLTSATN